MGRWLGGAWGGFLSLVCLAASPLALSFGGRVMVETFLALWILLAYALSVLYLTAPSRKVAAALGVVVALALLTKLTTILFLPGPIIYGCVRVIRKGEDKTLHLKRLALCIAVCVAVAGPWYAKNAVPAVKFAFFSAKYNEVATGRERVPAVRRAAEMAGDLAGWPLAITVAACGLAVPLSGRVKSREVEENRDRRSLARKYFTRMAWLGASLAAAVLFYPTYFDSRFLLPIWPVLAVGIGLSLFSAANGLAAIPRIAIGVGLAGSLLLASISVVREPNFATYWGTTELIDELVNRYGVSNLVNVGNCAAWNVCKTGLMNELREKPGSCFVLHDLTRAGEGRAERLLEQADAVVVLGRSDLSEAVMQVAPGLNRGYGAAVENLGRNPAFRQVPLQTTRGLPVVSVFVRRTEFGQAGESSKSEPRRRR